MRRFMASGLLASLGSILLACSSTQVSPAKAKMVPSAPTTSAEEEERAALESALTKVQNKQYAEAITALQSVIDIPAFTELGQSQQHLAIYAAGIVALNLNDYPRAAKFLKRSSSFEQAGLNDWIGRLRAAYVLKDVSDSALCLATIAKRWPQTLGTYDDRYVFSLVRQTTSLGDQEPRFQLINALYQAYWKPKSGIEPSSLWMELSLLLLERHDADRAASVAAHVSDPYSLISLHADKRFDDIVMADPGQFDVISAVDLEIQRLQSAIEKAPKLLTLRVQLTYALLTARRYKEVLNVTDQIIAQVANGDGSQS